MTAKTLFYEKQRGRLLKLTLLKKYLCECMVWKIRFWLTLQRNPRSAPQSLQSVHTPKIYGTVCWTQLFRNCWDTIRLTNLRELINTQMFIVLLTSHRFAGRTDTIRLTNLRYRRIDQHQIFIVLLASHSYRNFCHLTDYKLTIP